MQSCIETNRFEPMSKMAEAEVSVRLASWLIDQGFVEGCVDIAIDGAQVQVKREIHFDLTTFLKGCGWIGDSNSSVWQCGYRRAGGSIQLRVHSNPGKGDVVARLRSGAVFRAECKKGPLSRSRISQEYPLLREALGQLLTVEEIGDGDVLAVAVPHGEKFKELAARWRRAPLVRRLGIQILTVASDGSVNGFEMPA
jgi:hypothetical protein